MVTLVYNTRIQEVQLGGIFGLEAVNFIDKKAKYTMGPSKFKYF